MSRIIKKLYQSFRYAFRGLRDVWQRELSFRLELLGGGVLVAAGYLFWPLRPYEFLFLVLAFLFILAMELHNTALERALERLHPQQHDLVGAAKDTAAAAVFIAVVFALAVVVTIMLRWFMYG